MELSPFIESSPRLRRMQVRKWRINRGGRQKCFSWIHEENSEESPNGENEYKEAFFKQTNDIFRNLFE